MSFFTELICNDNDFNILKFPIFQSYCLKTSNNKYWKKFKKFFSKGGKFLIIYTP
jgi:hypothetical protein